MNKKLILILVMLALVASSGITFFLFNKKNSQSPIADKASQIDTEVLSNTYSNNEINFSFSYPKESVLNSNIAGAPYPGIINASGKKFTGYIRLPSGSGILFGGVTKDYSYPRGGSIGDFLGYGEKNDEHFLNFIWGANKIIPSDKISINNGKDIAIVLKNTEIEMLLNDKQIAAFINTKSNIFPGLVFVISYKNEALPAQDIEIFNNIISSIKFE